MTQAPTDIIVHIPHASADFTLPGYKRTQLFTQRKDSMMYEIKRITDWYTDELFAGIGVEVTAPKSRILVDVERFYNDDDEPMAQVGRGMIYTNDARGIPLRNPPEGRLRNDLHRLYHEHHNRLTQAVDRALEEHGRCLIIDAHSFPHRPLPIEQHQEFPRRDICIGTDSFHTPDWLPDDAADRFNEAGLSVEFNRPFAGTIVPMSHLGESPNVHSIMIEINRRLYLRHSMKKKKCFEEFRENLHTVLTGLTKSWRGRDRRPAGPRTSRDAGPYH